MNNHHHPNGFSNPAKRTFLTLPLFGVEIRTGGGERARTDDLLRARQALSQLSYTPEKMPSKSGGGPGWS